MSYNYQTEREKLFNERGQRLFIGMRDNCMKLLDQAGAFSSGKGMDLPPGIGAADTWEMLAVFDRMIELGEIREITGPSVAGQDRVFVKVHK